MTGDEVAIWTDANQRHLVAALAKVRASLERHIAQHDDNAAMESAGEVSETASDPATTDGAAPALVMLCQAFGLSGFERDVLLLCAGIELDAAFAGLCARAQADASKRYPTWSLALAALPDPHWSAVTPAGALRTWRLVDVISQGVAPLTASPLKIDERILHFLTGIQYVDERLAGLMTPTDYSGELVASHAAAADQMSVVWRQARGRTPIELFGADETSRRNVAAAACGALGMRLFAVPVERLPTGAVAFESIVGLLDREAVLTSSAIYLDVELIDVEARAARMIDCLLERINGLVVLSAPERWRSLRQTPTAIELRKPAFEEQQSLWTGLLADTADVNGHASRLAAQFRLSPAAIRASVREALASTDGSLEQRLWDAGRAQARPRLEALAHRIESDASWDDLVLPDAEKRSLRQIVDQVAHRATVYNTWKFGKSGGRGLGISVLFCGASGTGKTMAAEVMAAALRLDLYRIDLAGVVSKYIGETEKNLRGIFDAAEDGGAILFFDEADALFGKRSDVKDSHDRYANIEINYLLQRMEAFGGLAILATNRKGDLDPAFLRRLRFVVQFPFPESAQRAEIWRRVFPPAAPQDGLDWDRLASLNVAGGNIRNIALQAAFLAAAAAEPIRMPHIARAAASEFAKLEKPFNEAVLGGRK